MLALNYNFCIVSLNEPTKLRACLLAVPAGVRGWSAFCAASSSWCVQLRRSGQVRAENVEILAPACSSVVNVSNVSSGLCISERHCIVNDCRAHTVTFVMIEK